MQTQPKASGPGWVMLVAHTMPLEVVRSYRDSLRKAGIASQLSRETTDATGCTLVVLCGVSANLTRARFSVEVIEQLYGPIDILVLTHHEDPEKIKYFSTPRTTVSRVPLYTEELVETVRQLLQHKTAAS